MCFVMGEKERERNKTTTKESSFGLPRNNDDLYNQMASRVLLQLFKRIVHLKTRFDMERDFN